MVIDQRQDRRVVRSRRLLQEALVALVLEHGYDAVTVHAILARADVGRATFYAHFSGKAALLLSLFDDLQASLEHAITGITPQTVERFGQGVGLLQPLFAHAARNRRLYRALLSAREGSVLLRYLREALATPLRTHLESAAAQHGVAPNASVELVVTAIVSAVLGALVWWLEAERAFTPEQMDRVLERLLSFGIGGALGLHAGPPLPRPPM